MDKYNKTTNQELMEMIKEIVSRHNSKKEEIVNLSRLMDKKIEDLGKIEREYVELLTVVNNRTKDVREKIQPAI